MIPDEIRTALHHCIHYTFTSNTMYQSAQKAQNWLDVQPTAPEPDWRTAAPDTQYHTIDASGLGIWWDTSHPPQTVGLLWEPDELDKEQQYPMIVDYVYDLPLGIDWRTTLRRRPEAA